MTWLFLVSLFWIFIFLCVVDWLVGWMDFSNVYLVWLIRDNVFYSSDCLQTQYVEEVGLELLILLPLPTGCCDLQVFAIMPRSVQALVSCIIICNIFSWLKSLPEWLNSNYWRAKRRQNELLFLLMFKSSGHQALLECGWGCLMRPRPSLSIAVSVTKGVYHWTWL